MELTLLSRIEEYDSLEMRMEKQLSYFARHKSWMCHLLLPLIVQDAADNLCFVVVCGASMGCGGAVGAVPGRERGDRGSNETVDV